MRTRPLPAGVRAALAAAFLFGAGALMAKLLLGTASPWLLAGLLYLDSGLGLAAWGNWPAGPNAPASTRADWLLLAGAVGFGGVAGPVLLMVGLTQLPASGASLLLNAEGVLTALIAWIVFRENVDRWVGLGMLVRIVARRRRACRPAG